MITLIRFDGVEFVVNADLIETVEETPDTIIRLTTGRKYLVKDSMQEIVNKVTKYKQKINHPVFMEVNGEIADVEGV